MDELKREIETCKRCGLHELRTNAVSGEGSIDADIMFVGEAPGYHEDKKGRPFVGSAGKNLNELLKKAELKRDHVFICNVLKCRPPNNRDPTEKEIELCTPFLKKQVRMIEPKLIVSLGRFAARVLLNRPVSVGRAHGTIKDCSYGSWECKIFISYHPAAALYGNEVRRKLEEDFKKLGEIAKKLDEIRVSRQTTL